MGKVFINVADLIDKDVRIIDTRFNLQVRDWGFNEFQMGHINGAIYMHLENDLSDMTSNNGRHPMPSRTALQELFERSGLSYEDDIVVYDQGGSPFAPRAWWMLKYAGFPNVHVVNGGFAALEEADFGVTNKLTQIKRTSLELKWNDGIYATREDVKAIVDGKHTATLLDARAALRYRGEQEPLDPVAGHIPTAKNFDWEQVKDGSNLAPTAALLDKVSKDEPIVVYCGSGVTASPLYAVLADADYENIRLYVGSYSDWITEYDIEVGENK